MNYGIGNVKAKSSGGGGGGIPVITLQASQMVDQTHIQFTEEQYNTIVANGCFYLDLLGSQQLLMTCVNASNLADIQCYNISQTGSGLQLATIDLNKTTYIGVLGVSPYPQAKQLYEHNIMLYKSNSNEIYNLLIQIINSNSSQMGASDILDFLNTNGYTKNASVDNYSQNMYRLSGSFRDLFSSPKTSKQFCGVVYNDSTSIYAYILSGNDLGMSLDLSTMTITDTITTL